MVRVLTIIAAIVVVSLGAMGFLFWQQTRGLDAEAVNQSYLEDADRFVAVEGLGVRVRDEGPRDAPVILMLHGFTYSLESYDALAADLSQDYRVVRYDLRGHGLTGPDPQKRYAPQQRAEHIGAIMDALEIETAHVVGNSLGGLAAWRFAATEPSAVDGLILISPGAYPINGVTEEPAPVPAALEAYLLTVPESGLELSLARVYADPSSLSQARKEEIRAMMRREGNGQAFIDALNLFVLPDPDPILATITAPTLIIWGEQDQVISSSHGERLLRVMPDAELVTLPNVGHVAHEEDPEHVAAEIRQFLSAGSQQ